MENTWIKITEKLPEDGDIVIVFSPHVVRTGYLYKNTWYKNHNNGDLDPIWFSEVTHWMPLPEPPTN